MQPLSALQPPAHDPSPIFEAYRGAYASQVLTASAAHFHLFEIFGTGPLTLEGFAERLSLSARSATVLLTALRALGLIVRSADSRETLGHAGTFTLAPVAAEHLRAAEYFDVSDYLGLAAQDPGVLALVERLRTNRPTGVEKGEQGAAFIFKKDLPSAMEDEAAARRFTLALCGRAKNVAPHLAARVPLEDASLLVDIGGGTGIYAIACLQRNPRLRAVVADRPEVLKVAAEFAAAYGVADRLDLQPFDMWSDPLPAGDVFLLSNILHDWDVPECEELLRRCGAGLPASGRLLLHDVFLRDELDGPLPTALYSVNLFMVTEGRAYSAAEYRRMLEKAGLSPEGPITPTLIHCGALTARKL